MNQYTLTHHGVPGMKWGVRRYQNKDGTLTPAGQKKAAKQESKDIKTAKQIDALAATKKSTLILSQIGGVGIASLSGLLGNLGMSKSNKYMQTIGGIGVGVGTFIAAKNALALYAKKKYEQFSKDKVELDRISQYRTSGGNS